MKKLISILVITVFFLITACDKESKLEEFPKHQEVQPLAVIKLPAKPDIDTIANAARTTQEGKLTITGLILDKKEHLTKQVQVSGIIKTVSEDCPFLTNPVEIKNRPKKGTRELRKCKVVYITVADTLNSKKELLVVDYHPFYHSHLKVGMPVDITGKYHVQGAGFIRSRDGLLIADDFENIAVDIEGNFTDDLQIAKEMKINGKQAGTIAQQ